MPKVKTKYKDLLFQDKMRALRLAPDYPDISILDMRNIYKTEESADGGNLGSKSYYRELLSIPYAPNINKYGWGSNLILGVKDAGIFKSEDGGNALSAANIGKSVGSALKGGLGAIGNTVGKIGGNLISNGYTSTAGKVASVASGLASYIPGPIGGIASAAIGVLGGVANRAFGTKTDLEKLNNANQNIAELSNFQSNAGSFDDLAYTPASVNISGTFKDGWFSHSAAKKQRALENQLAEAKGWALNSVRNNMNNLIDDLNDLLAQQFFALGGYMPSFGGGAIDYQLATDRINIDRIKADKNDKITSLPNSSNNPLNNNSLLSNFAFGGPMLSTYTEGSVYNLSEKEIERLRALGYEIEEVE